jgi:hypothetical protein
MRLDHADQELYTTRLCQICKLKGEGGKGGGKEGEGGRREGGKEGKDGGRGGGGREAGEREG